MESIMQKDKECYICRTTSNLHLHHCLYGTSGRKKATQYGLMVYLCQEHHTGNTGVHHNPNKGYDLLIKRAAQRAFEANHGTREDFIKEFGRNYLE